MASIGPTTTEHPVAHHGLYWTLQRAVLESTKGSIVGSTTGSILTPAAESAVGFTLDSATGSYEEFEHAPGSPQRLLLVSAIGHIGVCNPPVTSI
eukprot:1016762-Lingulodinium_polyedra.AAC.1